MHSLHWSAGPVGLVRTCFPRSADLQSAVQCAREAGARHRYFIFYYFISGQAALLPRYALQRSSGGGYHISGGLAAD